ncbi:uncharacterized protein LOC144544603 [Carex rostrata]
MGCCCSKKEAEEKENEKEKALKKPRWDPPPPPPEEETVKEVLSETPKTKPKLKPKPPPAPSSPVHKPEGKETSKDELEKNLKPKPSEIPPSDDRSEQPQPSDDACSLSEATSNATSVTTREREREEISTTTATSSIPRIPRGNANGYNRRSYSGELVGGARRERSSPAVVAGLGCRSGRSSPGPPLRNNRSLSGHGNGVKRDLGERSGRRSLSPGAKRREVAGTSGPGERLGANRGVPIRRVPPLLPNKAVPQLSEVGGGPGNEGKESLDNPSVSLECFIFL